MTRVTPCCGLEPSRRSSALAARLFCVITVSMARQTVITRKKRGPPATGKGELIGVRLQPPALAQLDVWIGDQADKPSRPEAIRRLLEQALSAQPPARQGGAKP